MSNDPKYAKGFYSDNTKGCYDVIAKALPLCEAAMEPTLKLHANSSSFVVADYGTADGGTSMPLMYQLCSKIRATVGNELPIQIHYEDQPVNDWGSLFMRLEKLIEGPQSFLQDFDNTFAHATGRSFYKQCYPANSVHFGFSATAMHWLTSRPCGIPDAIHHSRSNEGLVKQEFARQAREDWEQILRMRARELIPGGRMVIVNFCLDSTGQCLGNVQRESGHEAEMYATMEMILSEMEIEGLLTAEEVSAISLINYYRTRDEFLAPFKEDGVATSVGLRLVSYDTHIVPCPYHANWMSETSTRTPAEHAKWYVPTCRTWSNSTFINGLSDERTGEEKRVVVDDFFGRYEKKVAEEPKKHGMDYVHAYVVFEKNKL